jgi:hypothetical protein
MEIQASAFILHIVGGWVVINGAIITYRESNTLDSFADTMLASLIFGFGVALIFV